MAIKSFQCDVNKLEEPSRKMLKALLGNLELIEFCYVTKIDYGIISPIDEAYVMAVTAHDVIKLHRDRKSISFELWPLNKIITINGTDQPNPDNSYWIYIHMPVGQLTFFFENTQIRYEFISTIRQCMSNNSKAL